MEEPLHWEGTGPGGRLLRRQVQISAMHLPQLQQGSWARQLAPPHDLIAAFARRWLSEQVLTARPGHRAQGQDARANNRAVPTGLRLKVPLAFMCGLWLVNHHLDSSFQAPSCCLVASLRLPISPQKTMAEGRRNFFFPKG